MSGLGRSLYTDLRCSEAEQYQPRMAAGAPVSVESGRCGGHSVARIKHLSVTSDRATIKRVLLE